MDYYRTVLQDPALHGSVLYSLYLAFTSALLSTAGGVALSALLVACKRPDSLLLRLPITIPHTVAAFLGMALLSQTGLFSRLAALMGLVQAPDAFPLLIQDPWGIGVILTYTCKQIPYVMSVVILLMRRVWGSGARRPYPGGGAGAGLLYGDAAPEHARHLHGLYHHFRLCLRSL